MCEGVGGMQTTESLNPDVHEQEDETKRTGRKDEVGWLSLLLGIDVAVAAPAFIMQQQLLRIIVLTNEIAFKSNSRGRSSIRSPEHVRTTCREFDSNLYLAVSVCF